MSKYSKVESKQQIEKYFNEIESNTQLLQKEVEKISRIVDKGWREYLSAMYEVILEEENDGLAADSLCIQGEYYASNQALSILYTIEDSFVLNHDTQDWILNRPREYEWKNLHELYIPSFQLLRQLPRSTDEEKAKYDEMERLVNGQIWKRLNCINPHRDTGSLGATKAITCTTQMDR